jgi:hypothetical protein
LANSKTFIKRSAFEEFVYPGDTFFIDKHTRGSSTLTTITEHIFLGYQKCKWKRRDSDCGTCRGLIKHAPTDIAERWTHQTGCYTASSGNMINITLPFDVNTRKILDDELFEI